MLAGSSGLTCWAATGAALASNSAASICRVIPTLRFSGLVGVAVGVVEAPLQVFRAAQADGHRALDGVILGHLLIQHQVGQHGAAYPVGTAAMEEDCLVCMVPQRIENPLHLFVTGGTGRNRDVDVLQAEL